MKEHGLTDSLEDYLKEIYILSKEDENVRDRCCQNAGNIKTQRKPGHEQSEGISF